MATLCGHRGLGPTRAGATHPENTLVSIEACALAGAEMVEFDVQISADDQPVLMHDDTVDRTTDGQGCVSALTLERLRELDLGMHTPLEGQGVRISTLPELLEEISIPLNVEIKVADAGCRRHDATAVSQIILEALATDPLRGQRRVLVSSFDLELLRVVRVHDATLELGWLIEDPRLRTSWVHRALDAGCQALHPYHPFITPELARECRRAELELNTWTVNDKARAQELASWGVSVIITDDPAGVGPLP